MQKRKIIRRSLIFRILVGLLVTSLSLTGCSGFTLPFLAPQATINPGSQPVTPAFPSSTAQPTQLVTATLTAPSGPQVISMWVPPQFGPENNTPAAALLKNRLKVFEDQNPDVKIQVRVKAVTGPGSLLETLAAALAAAPLALPSLVALPRPDLETAALKGLIYPLDKLLETAIDDPDWYAYARQMALIQGSTFGLPFAGDGMLLMYRPAHVNMHTGDWAGILSQGQVESFPAADPQGLLTLNLYLALGGSVSDAQGRPTLQPEILAQVLKLYTDGSKQGVFPVWLTQYQTDGQAWQAYREQSSQWLVTWTSRYLSELPADSTAVVLPSLGPNQQTLANGWVWALSDPSPERRAIAVRLAEFLVQGNFLAEWSAAVGYLPTRSSALVSWPDQNQRGLINQVVLSAQLRPSSDLMASLGPVLADATQQVIKRQNDPVQAAQAAAERLTTSTTTR